jgi:hypothetical protein
MLFKNLPLYNLVIDDDEELGVNKISLVDYPAVEQDFLLFNDTKRVDYSFTVQNEEKRIVSGIAMLADHPIYRETPNKEGYYVIFSKDTIEKIAHRFAKNNYAFNISVGHEIDVPDCYVVESFIINKERGIAPKEFADVEDGSWYTSVKIDNDDVWNAIKNGEGLNGFSVEIKAIAEEFAKTEPTNDKSSEDVPKANWLENILAGKLINN